MPFKVTFEESIPRDDDDVELCSICEETPAIRYCLACGDPLCATCGLGVGDVAVCNALCERNV